MHLMDTSFWTMQKILCYSVLYNCSCDHSRGKDTLANQKQKSITCCCSGLCNFPELSQPPSMFRWGREKKGKKGLLLHWCICFNPLHPNISMHILDTVIYTFCKVLKRRICFIIKGLFSWWSFYLFSWP